MERLVFTKKGNKTNTLYLITNLLIDGAHLKTIEQYLNQDSIVQYPVTNNGRIAFYSEKYPDKG